jgi:hypothetical protein
VFRLVAAKEENSKKKHRDDPGAALGLAGIAAVTVRYASVGWSFLVLYWFQIL